MSLSSNSHVIGSQKLLSAEQKLSFEQQQDLPLEQNLWLEQKDSMPTRQMCLRHLAGEHPSFCENILVK